MIREIWKKERKKERYDKGNLKERRYDKGNLKERKKDMIREIWKKETDHMRILKEWKKTDDVEKEKKNKDWIDVRIKLRRKGIF